MVLLTMTSSMVEALEKMQARELPAETTNDQDDASAILGSSDVKMEETTTESKKLLQGITQNQGGKTGTAIEPSLRNPKVGNPISHGQAIDLSKQLKVHNITPHSLDGLLRGARVFVAPSPPKPEPTPQYKALMARLRREEEERSYDRMTNPPPPMETFRQRFPASSAAHAFDSNHYPSAPNDPFAEKDEVEFADVDRQMGLIFNVLISIFACAGAIWVVARWWSTPARLALSMGGSMLVGIAEVVVYSGYVRRVSESKGKEKAVKEVKEIMKTWIIGGDENGQVKDEKVTMIKSIGSNDTGARKRMPKPT